jgi:hypothetical protein
VMLVVEGDLQRDAAYDGIDGEAIIPAFVRECFAWRINDATHQRFVDT